MTADDFVKLCYEEKEAILKSYFEEDTNLSVGIMIKKLIQSGTDKEELYRLIDAILAESYYTMLLGLDGEASLGGKQIAYKLFDEDGTLLTDCGEIEASAYDYFMRN